MCDRRTARDRVSAVEERVGIRRFLIPELILLVAAVLIAIGLMFRSSSGACHHWKDKLGHVTGAFLAAAGEEEYPSAGPRVQDREGLRRATKRLLDDRPFGCI
jgi:hypothetical protein